jgi:riboflavin synthase
MGRLRVGDQVNIEVDVIGKYVEKFLRDPRQSPTSTAGGIDRGFLAKYGFL